MVFGPAFGPRKLPQRLPRRPGKHDMPAGAPSVCTTALAHGRRVLCCRRIPFNPLTAASLGRQGPGTVGAGLLPGLFLLPHPPSVHHRPCPEEGCATREISGVTTFCCLQHCVCQHMKIAFCRRNVLFARGSGRRLAPDRLGGEGARDTSKKLLRMWLPLPEACDSRPRPQAHYIGSVARGGGPCDTGARCLIVGDGQERGFGASI